MATPNVPPISSVASKWKKRVEGAGDDYTEGVRTKGAKWQSSTEAASGSYKTAVTSGDIESRYKSGVSKAGSKYMKRSTAVGGDRFMQAAPLAEPDFASGMTPVLQAIGSVDLPARGPRGSAQNYNRVKPIGDALNKLRKSA